LLADQELGALGGVARNGAARLGAVGQAGGVAEKGEPGLRQALDERARTVRPPNPESKTPMVGAWF
jgi:hypothetical protein